VKYALLIYPGEATSAAERLSEEEQRSITAEYLALREEPGVFGGARLEAAESATTVRGDDGRTLTTDGPFANTKEILGGLYLLEADDLDAALDFAGRLPVVRMGGAVEVRPIWEM
jgi:hypothetical protein